MIENQEIPNSWEVVKLGAIAKYINGKAFKPTEWSKKGLPIIRIQNLNREKSEFNYCNFIVDDKYYVSKGDLLFAWSGTPDTSFGAHIWSGGRAVLNQHIFRIEVNENKITKQYYLYALNHKIKEFVSKSHGTAGLAHITKKIFEESAITLPPLPEQYRIVAKIEELFSSLDKGIESLKTTQQQLKVYRQAVLKWAFEGKLTNENVAEGQLPNGWIKEMVKDISFVNPKLPFESIDENLVVSFLPMKLVEAIINKISLTEFKQYKDVKRGFTPMIDGDVIFAKITPCMENGKIAVVHSLKNKIGFGSTEFHVFRCKKGYYNLYLFNYLIQERIRQDAERNMSGAVGQRRVPKKFLEELQIPLPPTIEEQQAIVAEIESRLSVCDKIEESIEQSLRESESLRQSILKKAFEGKLVPQDPSDLPAPRPGKWFVYVLECDDGSYYKGHTKDILERWKQHARGVGAEWTAKHPPRKLVHWEEFSSEHAAVEREKDLKTGFGRKWLEREIKAGRTRQAGEPAIVLLERIKAESEKNTGAISSPSCRKNKKKKVKS